ncbi:MAG TPA: hypothetical protein VJZ00_05785, partial [Thermoanaerobaculia bacterium]|nr:hypothetical protein [Thermoanaerobaculia bacterium]
AAVLLFLAGLQLHAQCGVERWSIKTGTDSQAPSISLSTWISTTIYNMRSSAKPASLPANSRLSPRELNQYRISGTLVKYVREGDSDYHLVVQDASARQMIVEIPAPNCIGSGSPFGSGVAHARSQFDARFTATTSMKSTSTPVTLRGIGFWDYIHGQTGVAPNGIEIHPVLDITFGSAALAPAVESEDGEPVLERTWPDDMVLDNDGGRVHVYRGGDGLANVLFHGGSVVENPSLQILFAGDSWSDDAKASVLSIAREINADARFADLWRYGVRTSGLLIGANRIFPDVRTPRGAEREVARELTDLDVQRALARAVEAGSIQHVDKETVYVVLLDRASASVGETRDFVSYHSEFHPDDLPMRYVVVQGGLSPDALRDAMLTSIYRALVNPAGDAWY